MDTDGIDLCARLNFLALDRIDLQFAAKECARKMARPTTMDWQRLKRVGRYLRGCPGGVVSYPFQDQPEFLTPVSDAIWAGDRQTRKSTSGGVVMFGQHYIKSWSKTQSLFALSSAEIELYALVKCVSELLGIRSALKDWGSNVGGVVRTDASAALGIILRQPCGSKDSGLCQSTGTANPADMCTKGIIQDKIHYLCEVNLRFCEGRADAAAKLQGS